MTSVINPEQKLKNYRLLKNTQKFNEFQRQRSPFVLSVPTGRWIEKKEPTRQARLDLNQTPTRNVLMNERLLKKTTVKNLIAKSTAKKENEDVMIFGKSPVRTVKSKKKILGQLNAVGQVEGVNQPYGSDESKLNDTFEVLRDLEDEKIDETNINKNLRRSKSLPEIALNVKPGIAARTVTPPTKVVKATKKPVVKVVPLRKPFVSAVSKYNSATTSHSAKDPPKAVVSKGAISKVIKPIVRLPVKTAKPNIAKEHEELEESIENLKTVKPSSKKNEQKHSQTFTLYKSMLNAQIAHLKIQLGEIESDKNFIESIDEEKQMSIHVAIQQGNLLVSAKLKKFSELLDNFEAGLNEPDNQDKMSSEDVDNYWYLLYEEIDETKKALDKIRDMKKTTEMKKRRSRRNYDEGTPKRSRRIAVNADTPK